MNSQTFDTLLEAALHTEVMRRCERAFVHELRDGLQSVAVSVDALSRIAIGKAPASMSADRVVELAKRGLQNHEQGLRSTVHEMLCVPTPAIFDAADAIRQAIKLLRNDAAARELAFNVELESALQIHADLNRLRLLLLGIATRLIEVISGRQVQVVADRAPQMVTVRFTFKSTEAGEIAALNLDAEPAEENYLSSGNWMLYAARRIARLMAGEVRTFAAQDELSVELKYQALAPSADAGSG